MSKKAKPYLPERTKWPLREWFLRGDKNAPLEGPYSYYEAEYKGRVSTREAARTGKGDICVELVQVVGERQGDPPVPPRVRVVAIYLAGRKVTGGALAQYNSDKGYT